MALRKNRPHLDRPWKVPAYPYTPIFALILCIILLFSIDFSAIIIGIIIALFGLIYYLMRISKKDRVRLILSGAKLAAVIILILFLLLIPISIKLDSTTNARLYGEFQIIGFCVGSGIIFMSILFDLIPLRQIFVRYFHNKSDIVIVGDLSILSPNKSKIVMWVNYIIGILLIVFGGVLIVYGLLASNGLIIYSFTYEIINTAFLNLITQYLFIFMGLIFVLNGIFQIYQEWERIQINPMK
jgi:hypothetical protein